MAAAPTPTDPDSWHFNGQLPPEPHQQRSSSNGGSQEPRRGEETDATYVAIEGLSQDALSTEEAERLERFIAEYVLGNLNKIIEDVRVVRGTSSVIEFERR